MMAMAEQDNDADTETIALLTEVAVLASEEQPECAADALWRMKKPTRRWRTRRPSRAAISANGHDAFNRPASDGGEQAAQVLGFVNEQTAEAGSAVFVPAHRRGDSLPSGRGLR